MNDSAYEPDTLMNRMTYVLEYVEKIINNSQEPETEKEFYRSIRSHLIGQYSTDGTLPCKPSKYKKSEPDL